MDLQAARIVSCESFALLVCCILAYGNRFEAKTKTRHSNIYFYMIITNIVAIACDAASWGLELVLFGTAIYYIADLMSYYLTLVLLSEFIGFLSAMVIEKTKERDLFIHASLYISFGLSLLFLIIFNVGGRIVLPNVYFANDDSWYMIYIAFCAIAILLATIDVFLSKKFLGKNNTIVCLLYLAIPTLSALINAFFVDFAYGYIASTLSLLLLYIFIQSDESSELVIEGAIDKFKATHDDLTGLFSRHAYSERIEELATQEGFVGVIFCDVNGLKYANDHFGHWAGDQLLTDFAELLKDNFPNNEVYRTGGDEFIVILTTANQAHFQSKVTAFQKALQRAEDPIACIGDEFGSCRKIEELIQMAENKMYVSKEAYYQRHPEQKRYL